jgi:hypothetical protein
MLKKRTGGNGSTKNWEQSHISMSGKKLSRGNTSIKIYGTFYSAL